MRAAQKPLGNATYVASDSDKEWLQSVQKKLHTRSWKKPSRLRAAHLWRARCITKGARRVRRGARGDLPGATRARRRAPTLLLPIVSSRVHSAL